MHVTSLTPRFVSVFLRADAGTFYQWVARRESQLIGFCVLAIVAGAGVYGAVMGSWSSRLQSLYAGIKLPLVILLTTLGNGLLNGMLAPLLSQWAANVGVARRVLLAWLVGNLFLGSQICWVLRPFIWDPDGPPQFLGRQYLHGSFYETIFEAVRRLLF